MSSPEVSFFWGIFASVACASWRPPVGVLLPGENRERLDGLTPVPVGPMNFDPAAQHQPHLAQGLDVL